MRALALAQRSGIARDEGPHVEAGEERVAMVVVPHSILVVVVYTEGIRWRLKPGVNDRRA